MVFPWKKRLKTGKCVAKFRVIVYNIKLPVLYRNKD